MNKSDPDAGLDVRRRRLRFRAWHRGTREMDLLLGRFADAEIANFDDETVDAFEALLEVSDPELYGWITGTLEAPPLYDTPLLRRLCAFHLGGPQ
jgi:antitoxin CptB